MTRLLFVALCCALLVVTIFTSNSSSRSEPRSRALATTKQTASPFDENDRRVYRRPAPPRLPRAGGKFRDPTFGTEIMRVTDEADGPANGTFYAYWPTFNATNTRLLVRRARTGDAIYDFDPVGFTLGRRAVVPPLPDRSALVLEGAIWSTTDPDILYAAGWKGPRLWAFNATSQNYRLVKDFSRLPGFSAGDFLWQMSMSADGDVFGFTQKNAQYQPIGYVVWRRSTDEILAHVKSRSEDEVRIDKSGRYLTIPLKQADAQGRDFFVRDLRTRVITGLTAGAPDHSPGHGDVGTGTLVAWDNDGNRLLLRELSNPKQWRSILELGKNWNNLHLSMLADDERWALVSFYSWQRDYGAGLFNDEILLVSTDGSGRVRRIAHHQSLAKEYGEIPRANISKDGKFVAFSSNWGGRKQVDLFIVRIEALNSSSVQRPRRTRPD